jgi:hypothetical protein
VISLAAGPELRAGGVAVGDHTGGRRRGATHSVAAARRGGEMRGRIRGGGSSLNTSVVFGTWNDVEAITTKTSGQLRSMEGCQARSLI